MYTHRRIHHLRPWTCGVEGSSLNELLSMIRELQMLRTKWLEQGRKIKRRDRRHNKRRHRLYKTSRSSMAGCEESVCKVHKNTTKQLACGHLSRLQIPPVVASAFWTETKAACRAASRPKECPSATVRLSIISGHPPRWRQCKCNASHYNVR